MNAFKRIPVPILTGTGKAFAVIRCDKRGFVVIIAYHRRSRFPGQIHHCRINRQRQALLCNTAAGEQGQSEEAENILDTQFLQSHGPDATMGAVNIQSDRFSPSSRPDGASCMQQPAFLRLRRRLFRQPDSQRRQDRQHRYPGEGQAQHCLILPGHPDCQQLLPAGQQSRPQQRGQQSRQQQNAETENHQKYFAVAGRQSGKQQQRKGDEEGYTPPGHRTAGTGMVRRIASITLSGVCRRTAA